MKKILLFTLVFLLAFSVTAFAGVEELTDNIILKDDFGYEDYKAYISDSVLGEGCVWPIGTTVIHDESQHNKERNIAPGAPSPVIPDSVVIFGYRCFEDRAIDGTTFDFSRFKNLKYIGDRAFRNGYNLSFSRIDLSGTKVIRIGKHAFNGCYTKTIVLPDTIKRIDEGAFYDARPGRMVFPEGLEYIGDGAFYFTSAVEIPKSVKFIGNNAFSPDAICTVWEGSYAEQWCKANGRKYVYAREKTETSSEQLGKTISIGPVTFTGYAGTHTYTTRADLHGSIKEVLHIAVYEGGKIISDYDGVDFLYNPDSWRLDKPEAIGKTDNTFNTTPLSAKPTLKTINDYGLIPHPSEKLPDGTWSKGLSWELRFNKLGALDMVVTARGRNYLYRINVIDPVNKVVPFERNYNAVPTPSRVLIDGKEVSFDAYNIKDNNYFKLRDVAYALSGSKKQFGIIWDGEKSCIDMVSGMPYSPVGGELTAGDGTTKTANDVEQSQLLKDGFPIFMRSFKINGNNYFKLRDLGKEFNFCVSWDGVNNCILIETDKPYTEE